MKVFGLSLILVLAVCLGCKQEPPSVPQNGHVEHADEGTFREKVLDSQVPVLVDFYADWCPPCKTLAPLLEDVAGENPNAKVVKVNVEESPGLAARYRIRSIPNLKVFKNGRVVAEHVGMADKRRIESLLSQ